MVKLRTVSVNHNVYLSFVVVVLLSSSTSCIKAPHTLADESHLEESLADRMIRQEDLKENQHLTELLGEDHLFNNANSLLVENNVPDEDGFDAAAAVGYEDNDSVESRNSLNVNRASDKKSVTATKKDRLSSTPEEALKSIGFAVDRDSESVTVTSDSDEGSPLNKLKRKPSIVEGAAKKTTMTNRDKSIKSVPTNNAKDVSGINHQGASKMISPSVSASSSSSLRNPSHGTSTTTSETKEKEKSPFEELYDEQEMKSVKETLVSSWYSWF